MKMDEGEIIRSYKEAKNKFNQVQILADLNCVQKKEMAKWLHDHGLQVDKRYLPGPRKAAVETEADQELETESEQESDEVKIADDGIAILEEPIGIREIPETGCVLTRDEALAVAELIDGCLLDAIRNDEYWDSVYALKNIIYAYDKMCKCSGYKGVTEP